MTYVFITDQGKVRPYNEDSGGVVCNKDQQPLYLIADGMGGHNAGDVASQMVLKYFQTHWQNQMAITRVDEAEKYLVRSIQLANEEIYQRALENEAYRGMGTTVVAVIFVEDTAVIAHVGDSRCYKITQDYLRQITKDHSLVNVLMHAGEITENEAKVHPKKNVLTRAVGTEVPVEVDISMVSCESHDVLLLCTDGLTNKLSDDEIRDMTLSEQSLEKVAEKMIDEANRRGGEDNISLVLIKQEAGGEASC